MRSDFAESLRILIRKHELLRCEAAILAAVRQSVRVVSASSRDGGGRSAFGGSTAILPTKKWPKSNGRSLTLIAQVDLGEIPVVDPDLPKSGVLSFFYEMTEFVTGDAGNRNGWKVCYVGDRTIAHTVQSPLTGLVRRPMEFRADITVPAFRSIEILPLNLTDDEFARYWEFRGEVVGLADPDGTEVHRILGHPDAIQGCMQRELQFRSRGLELPDGIYSWYEHPRAAELIPGSHDWRLLFQVGSDPEPFCWGDSGRLFFWIEREHLRNARFDQTWHVMQCG